MSDLEWFDAVGESRNYDAVYSARQRIEQGLYKRSG